jgi:hypothetical protein
MSYSYNRTAATSTYKVEADLPNGVTVKVSGGKLHVTGLTESGAEKLADALAKALGKSARYTMDLKNSK